MEELYSMPLRKLQGLDIRTAEEEAMVQTVINTKVQDEPVRREVHVRVPDIKTKEQEDYWQKKVDEAKELTKPNQIKMSDIVPNGDVEIPVNPEPPQVETKRFCTYCDAKGPIAHKKVCTRPR